ncbi:hypothetical protein ARSEF4850_010039 [Beauveria asiatica]
MDSLLPCIRQRKQEYHPHSENETNGIDRLIDFEGAFNVRDLGGISLSPTTVTRHGVILRSGHLEFLTGTGETKLSKLGITSIIDLRTSSEAKLIQNGRSKMRELVVFMHQNSSGAVILHCSLGKDRTGVVVALLLALLGASDDQIADDFALSGPGLAPMFAQTMSFVGEYYPSYTEAELREAVAQMLTPDRQAILILLRMIREEFGGPMEFFRDGCNVDGSVLLSLKNLLTEPRGRDSGRGLCYIGTRIKRILMRLSPR